MIIYTLFHSKEKNEIQIYKENWNVGSLSRFKVGEVNYWNENYFYSDNLEVIKNKAKDIKELWLLEFRMRIEGLERKRITVKNKIKRKG